MRAFEREPGESGKAFAAFEVYRSLGPGRSLRTVAEHVYGTRWKTGKRTVEKWSSRFDWVDRVAAFNARDAMIAREAVEEHLRSKASELAARRAALVEKNLEVSERAAEQALLMLRWPLVEKIVGEEDGQTILAIPAKWTKSNVKQMFEIAVAGGTGSFPNPDEDNLESEWDFSDMTDEEIKDYIRLSEKLKVKRADA